MRESSPARHGNGLRAAHPKPPAQHRRRRGLKRGGGSHAGGKYKHGTTVACYLKLQPISYERGSCLAHRRGGAISKAATVGRTVPGTRPRGANTRPASQPRAAPWWPPHLPAAPPGKPGARGRAGRPPAPRARRLRPNFPPPLTPERAPIFHGLSCHPEIPAHLADDRGKSVPGGYRGKPAIGEAHLPLYMRRFSYETSLHTVSPSFSSWQSSTSEWPGTTPAC